MNLYNYHSKPQSLHLYQEIGKKMDDVGTVKFRNSARDLHRDDDKPAIIRRDGTLEWYKNGLPHRDGDNPARIDPNGDMRWFREGRLHRDGDLPAVVGVDGIEQWYKNGVLHRDDNKPAIIEPDGYATWYVDGYKQKAGYLDANDYK
jgi:hypothetical protein